MVVANLSSIEGDNKAGAKSSTIKLSDGRNIGITTVGRSDGFPVMHFHGLTSSRLEIILAASGAIANGILLIGLDRPGIGRSDNKEGYTLIDWAEDIAEVADHLSIDRFAVEGVSGGGAYAMACAYKIPQRIRACGLISTISPPEIIMKTGSNTMRSAYWIGNHLPLLLKIMLHFTIPNSGNDIESIKKRFMRNSEHFCEAERRIFRNPRTSSDFAKAISESFRMGAEGNRHDALRLVRPWGFKLGDISHKNIFLWHGEQDDIVSVKSARLLAKSLPHCTSTFYPGDGHVSVPVNHAQDIFKLLLSR